MVLIQTTRKSVQKIPDLHRRITGPLGPTGPPAYSLRTQGLRGRRTHPGSCRVGCGAHLGQYSLRLQTHGKASLSPATVAWPLSSGLGWGGAFLGPISF